MFGKRMNLVKFFPACLIASFFLGLSCLFSTASDLPLIHSDDFEKDTTDKLWFPTQKDKWKITDSPDQGKALHLLGKSGAYHPPFRSPHSITLLKTK